MVCESSELESMGKNLSEYRNERAHTLLSGT